MNALFICCQLSQLAPLRCCLVALLPCSLLRHSESDMDVQAKNCLGTNTKYLLKGTRYPL